MALSDKWNLATLRVFVRSELMDPNARWWTNTEINQYINDWQSWLNSWFEFVWSESTFTVSSIGTATNSIGVTIPAGTAIYAISSVMPDALRPDAFYWITNTASNTMSGVRLSARDKQDLDILVRDWRNVVPVDPPLVVYQDSPDNIVFWPAPAIEGIVIAEYPKRICLASDTSTMQIPAWTRYSCANYCAYRAMLRTGPNQDIARAMRYKARFERQVQRYRRIWDNYFPYKYTQFRPKQTSDHYTIDILNPPNQTVIPP